MALAKARRQVIVSPGALTQERVFGVCATACHAARDDVFATLRRDLGLTNVPNRSSFS